MRQPRRYYPPDALALFAAYREHRAQRRPLECHQGSPCWVEDGPPTITSRGSCAGCGGAPPADNRPPPCHGRER